MGLNMIIKVGLVQINNSFSGQNYFPYSVGLLQAYAEKYLHNPNNFEFLLPIYTRVKVEDALEHLVNADIVLFSTYVWNFRLSLKIAEKLKAKHPGKFIAFGGPHVPDTAKTFLKKYPFINMACHKEGERIIVPLLENYQKREKWKVIPSVSFINEDGNYIQNQWAERIKDLDEIPSPYIENIFKPLIKANPGEEWLVMWETNRGCPFSCTFCDWGSATIAKVNKFGLDRLYAEIDWVKDQKIEFIFCCDANFGILPRDYELAKYTAKTKDKYGYPIRLSVQNTKNARERAYKVQKYLSDSGLNKGVTLALQSLDEKTLKFIKRDNISLDIYQDLQHRFTKDKIETYTDMIIGMPGETYDSFFNGISDIIINGQHNRIQFGNLSVLPNAEMGDPEYQRKHGMEIVETEIINLHGSLLENEEIYERQQLVVSTNSMPREDWAKIRAICWLTGFLHFNKVLQIPFILLHNVTDLTFRELIEIFSEKERIKDLPIIAGIQEFFLDSAKNIQNGGAEYFESTKWLNIWWPHDEFQLIELCTSEKLLKFYSEAELLVTRYLEELSIEIPSALLKEAIKLNYNLIKMPFNRSDQKIELSYNIWEFYRNHLIGIDIPIEEDKFEYIIDRTSDSWQSWEQWCKEVIWYGNKKGDYLYSMQSIDHIKSNKKTKSDQKELAGHY